MGEVSGVIQCNGGNIKYREASEMNVFNIYNLKRILKNEYNLDDSRIEDIINRSKEPKYSRPVVMVYLD